MFIKTERMLLRPPWPEDAPVITAAIADWSIIQMLGRAPWPYTLDDAETFVRMAGDAAEAGREHALLLNLLPTAQVIGSVGVTRLACGAWELGYWLARHWWGRGLVTEAATALIDTSFASLPAHELVAGHYLDNPASAAVLAKLGFVPTVKVKRWSAGREAEVDLQELRLTRAKWLEHRQAACLHPAAHTRGLKATLAA